MRQQRHIWRQTNNQPIIRNYRCREEGSGDGRRVDPIASSHASVRHTNNNGLSLIKLFCDDDYRPV